MEKKSYQKPTVELLCFSVREALMDGEGSGSIIGPTYSAGASPTEPFSMDDGYQLGGKSIS